MAIVNVDLSEYDAIRKRNSELEEQVKELKKLNDSLKQGAKVILRKEKVVEVNVPRPRYGRFEPGFDTEENPITRRTVESSESYVNFEDVRMKVENAMQDEVKRSIHDRDCAAKDYNNQRNELIDSYNKKEVELEKIYKDKERDFEKISQDKERDLREKYARMTSEFEAEKLRILNKLPKIATMATDLRDELNKCFFKPKFAIKLANDIIDFSQRRSSVWTD